jgi:Tol biopolymer transport system component
MGPRVNTGSNEICPMVSPDGRYFFFNSYRSGNADNYWMDASVIADLRGGG